MAPRATIMVVVDFPCMPLRKYPARPTVVRDSPPITLKIQRPPNWRLVIPLSPTPSPPLPVPSTSLFPACHSSFVRRGREGKRGRRLNRRRFGRRLRRTAAKPRPCDCRKHVCLLYPIVDHLLAPATVGDPEAGTNRARARLHGRPQSAPPPPPTHS